MVEEPGRGPSPDTDFAGALILDFLQGCEKEMVASATQSGVLSLQQPK